MGPPKAMDALRKGLAMGADRAVLVSDDALAGADLVATSKALAAALAAWEPDLVLFGQQSADGNGACLWAAVAERLGLPGRLAGRRADDRRRRAHRAAADGVRLRDAARAAARGRRRLGRDQRAALPVAQGDHGREVEAAGDARPRTRSAPTASSATTVLALAAAAAARREPARRGRRRRGRGDRRVPRREAAAVKLLVFLEHHDGALTKASLGVLATRAPARRRARPASSPARACGALGRRRRAAPSSSPTTRGSRRRCRSRASTCSRRSSATRASTPCCSRSPCSRPTSPRALAARLEAGLNWDLVDLAIRDGALVGTQPALGDSVYVEAGWTTPGRARESSGPAPSSRSPPGGGAEVRDVAVELEEHSTRVELVEHSVEEAEGPSIEDADVVVAGGRGLGAPEGFALVEELADALGGAVGGDARRRRRGLVPVPDAGRPDRQDGLAEALRRGRHLGRDPAQGRDAGLGHDRRDQQGPARADLRVRRPRRRRRPERDRPAS